MMKIKRTIRSSSAVACGRHSSRTPHVQGAARLGNKGAAFHLEGSKMQTDDLGKVCKTAST